MAHAKYTYTNRNNQKRRNTRWNYFLSVLIALVLLAFWAHEEGWITVPGIPSTHSRVEPKDAPAGSALALLNDVPVKGRAPKTGYRRDNFGPAWFDVDINGCDTRNDILRRDLTNIKVRNDGLNCTITSGVLISPYTKEQINFRRGPDTSPAVQIDHVVALSDAWQKGAQQLDSATLQRFANDPLNLLAVDGDSNQQKGASDAASWLPKNKAFRCEYVARQVGVKHKYHLWVTKAEREAMVDVLSTCPEQKVPAGGL